MDWLHVTKKCKALVDTALGSLYIYAMSTPKRGVTADRKTPENLKFIVENYSSMKNAEMAERLGQTPRWVKRQISLLKKKGLIQPKRAAASQVLGESSWTAAMKDRARYLCETKKFGYEQVALALNEEFGLALTRHTAGWWLRRFGIKSLDNRTWLRGHVKKSDVEDMLSRDMRVVDMAGEIERIHGVRVNDDDLLIHIKSIGLDGPRWHRIHRARGIANSGSDEEFEESLKKAGSVAALSRERGVSETVLHRRIAQAGIALPERRVAWSGDLEAIRDLLVGRPPMETPPRDEDVHQMLLGWLMGDGHLDFNGRFVVNHSLAQLSYLYVKAQILRDHLSNVVTVPRKGQAYEDCVIVSEEQIGLSCPGFDEYCRYLNPDGSRNFEMIAAELNDLGRACYFMDDGSQGDIVTAGKSIIGSLENRFFFKNAARRTLRIEPVPGEYILPGFWYKSSDEGYLGSYWETYFPELFKPAVNTDLDLSFVNKYVVDLNPEVLHDAVAYYHSKGFPAPRYGDEYLRRSWKLIESFQSRYLWKSDTVLRYANVGDELFKHYMPHMSEATYRGVSPADTFSGHSTLHSTLQYCLKSKKSILPKFVRNALIQYSGGVTAFPSVVAKAVVERYSPPGGVVVDPCAGWGGRMLGAVSSGRSYVGFEPWGKTHKGLCAMRDFVSAARCDLVHGGFSLEGAPERCHLVFTSPPYIDLEVYGRKMGRGEWRDLMGLIFQYAESALEPGGYLVLNLPRNLHCALPRTRLEGLPTRYWNTRSRQKEGEPLYVWRK